MTGEVAALVAEQRKNGDPEFVFISKEGENIPGLRAALEDEARASGRMLVRHAADAATRRVLEGIV